MHRVIEFDCECHECGATGLYVGMAEHNGAAVQCRSCEGTGKVHRTIEYNDFEGRKAREGIRRVVQVNPGIGIGEGPLEDGRKVCLEDFGGMPYEEWAAGKPFPPGSEMRLFSCPLWWFQCVDYKKKPDWPECISFRSFSDCKHFATKDRCWAEWDRENGGSHA